MEKDSKKLVFKDVSSRVNSDELERSVLGYWDKEEIFEKSLKKARDKGELFTFYDGPPYATGKPHYGHISQSAIKDAVLRYKTMKGFYVPRRVGWDCHGLPVETIVEKNLGFKTKKDIEKYGIEKFNKKCRATVFKYIDEFTDTLKRMGRWADYDNAYATLDKDYMESEWWVFKRLWEMDLIYEAFRSTPYCVRCATPLSNFEVASNYKDKTDTAVYVLLKVKGKKDLYLLIWTTTPWTLPGNAAVAISKELKYVSVEHEGKEVIVAKERIEDVFGEDFKVVKEWKLEELQEFKYESLYPEVVDGTSLVDENEFPALFSVIVGDHVTADEGTGLVHIAPAFGEEDAKLGNENDLPPGLRPVDTNGRFTEEVPNWAGESIWDANKEIVKDLDKRGLLFDKEQYKHSYPFCWRCEEPLIYYALDTWFVKVSKIKEQMLATNEQINWIPEHIKHGRFGKGIESAPDWAVSRNRFWSVPLPVWECDECENQECVGSVDDLQKLSGQKEIKDMHRPYVDEITWKCSECEGVMHRVSEVLDAWFDSGSMPYSQWHYPFDNRKLAQENFPADFIVEGLDQTRAWFYVLHVVATALTTKGNGLDLGENKPAFENAIGSGLIFAEDGQKLSKKLKNYPDPEPTIAKYGADVLRMYLLSSASFGEPYLFSEKEIQQLQRNVYLTLWNVYSFFVRYANTHEWKSGNTKLKTSNVLDEWILVRLNSLEVNVQALADNYHFDQAARAFIPFVDDLSNWYVRRSRNRFQKPVNDEERDEAFGTLYEVLVRTAKLLAAFMPFVSEEIYRNLTGGESVHLEKLGEVKELSAKEKDVLERMEELRAAVSGGLALRAKRGVKVRQPLATMEIVGEKWSDELIKIAQDEVNVKEIKFVEKVSEGMEELVLREGEVAVVGLDIENITPELKREGLAREIIRHGQVLRREAEYALDDRIIVVLKTNDEELKVVVNEYGEMIKDVLQADDIVEDAKKEDNGKDLEIEGKKTHLGVISNR
jgi:isoleucyl-tRNA synthetase